jgi:formylglycine-generating enzyme required for sulfatase activity
MSSSPRLQSCVLVAWVMAGLVTVARADEAIPPNGLASTFAGTKAGQIREDNGLKMKLVWCPPAEFTMGSPQTEKGRPNLRSDNNPRINFENQVRVTLSRGFWLGRCEVTQSEWRRLMVTTPWRAPDVPEGFEYAASNISRDDALKFCEKLTNQERRLGRLPSTWRYTLPTEAQWEYACRATTTTRFNFGDDDSKLSESAWFADNAGEAGQRYAHPVGVLKPNRWGLYDMHGNVWEWTRDWYTDQVPGGLDPEVSVKAKWAVMRGGSWTNGSGLCRSAFRNMHPTTAGGGVVGFRVAAVASGK